MDYALFCMLEVLRRDQGGVVVVVRVESQVDGLIERLLGFFLAHHDFYRRHVRLAARRAAQPVLERPVLHELQEAREELLRPAHARKFDHVGVRQVLHQEALVAEAQHVLLVHREELRGD